MCLALCDAGIFLDILHLRRAVLKKPVCTCLLGHETRHYECKNEIENHFSNQILSQFYVDMTKIKFAPSVISCLYCSGIL